jgi:AhpD family alkylhydroperoxidase
MMTRKRYGQAFLPPKLMAHNPSFLLPYLGMTRFVSGKAELEQSIRLLATHLVSRINGCSWCADFGHAEALREGVAADKLAAVLNYDQHSAYTPAERAALAVAEYATQVGAVVPDAIFDDARRYFSEREMLELLVAVAAENFFNRLNIPLEVEDQGFCNVSFDHQRGAA